MVIYTVKNGDSLYNIARRYGTTAAVLARDNELLRPTDLTVGQTLVILSPQSVYRVVAGDNIYSVAQKTGATVNELWRNNPFLGGKTELEVGEVLTIVPEAPVYDREVSISGYIYPSVDRDVLRQTLPFLTNLVIFTYGIEENGELIGVDDSEVIELARQYGTAPVMLVSTLGAGGTFSGELAGRVLSDAQARQTLIEEIATTLRMKRYAGVEIDFEYVPGEYAETYADFIAELRERVSQDGYFVYVSLAPKTSADQPGTLYEGHDYAAMGEAADRTFLMTYEWGYTYGPPMAVSPVNKVREVLDYATSVIPPEKILMGVPNYGYNWTLPYVRGESRAQSLGTREAVALARQVRAAIEYDEVAEAPYFRYFERVNGAPVEHIVWFEDARSVEALIRQIENYGLDGAGVWNVMRYFPQMWQVINHTYRIRRGLQ